MNFGNAADWHLSPEQSLQLGSGERALPLQLKIWMKAGHNQLVVPPHGCSLFLYRAPNMLPSKAEPNEGGLRLVELPPALVAVGARFFRQQRGASPTWTRLRRPVPATILDRFLHFLAN